MASVAELKVMLTAADQMSPTLKSAGGSLSGLGSAAGVAAKAVGVAFVAAGAGIAAGVAAGIKGAGDLQQSVANISTIKPEIDTSGVFNSLNEMSTRVPQSAAQLGDSLYNIFSSVDVTQAGALQLLEKFAQGAVGASTDAETFGTAAMGVMNAYGMSVEEAGHISDVFFNTVKLGVVTGQELATGLGPVTQSAKQAGVSLDQLGGFIAGVTKEGGPAAQNINNLNNFLMKVTTSDAQLEMQKLGIATTTATGEFRELPDVLTDLKAALAALPAAEASEAMQHIFPDAQARTGASVLMSQLDFVKGAIDENINTAGAAEAAFAKMNATFNSQMTILGNTFTAILTTVGAQILPMITPIIVAFSQQLPVAFAAAGVALAPLGAAFQRLFEAIAPLVSGGGIDVGAIFTAMASAIASAVMTIADVIGTLTQVAAGDWAPDADQINPFVNAVGIAATVLRDQLMPAFSDLVALISNNLGVIVGVVAAFATFQTLAAAVGIITGVAAAWGTLSAAIAASGGIIAAVVAILGGPITIAIVAVAAIVGVLAAAWVGNWGDIQGKTAAAGAAIGTALAAVGSALAAAGQFFSDLGTAASAGVSAVMAAWDALPAATSTAWDAVVAAVQGAWDLVVATIVGAGIDILNAVMTGWTAVTDSVQSALDAIHAAVTAVWNLIPADIQADLILIVAHVATQLGLALTNIVTWVTETSTAFVTWGADVLSGIISWAAGVLSAFTTWGTQTTAAVTTTTTSWLTTFTTKFSEIITAVGTWVTEFLAPMTKLATEAGAKALEIGTAIWKGITDKIREVIVAITTWGGEVIREIGAVAGKALTAAGAIGKGILDGIVGAIAGKANQVGTALWDVVRGGLDIAKRAAGISSPSTLAAAEIGSPLADGIIQGLIERFGQGRDDIAEGIRAVINTAILKGIDPIIASSLAMAESGFKPKASGDGGWSDGLFQMNRNGGQGVGYTQAQLQDPWMNAETFLSTHSALFQTMVGKYSGGELAARFGAAAERPADSTGSAYAAAYEEITAALGPMLGALDAAAVATEVLSTEAGIAAVAEGVLTTAGADKSAMASTQSGVLTTTASAAGALATANDIAASAEGAHTTLTAAQMEALKLLQDQMLSGTIPALSAEGQITNQLGSAKAIDTMLTNEQMAALALLQNQVLSGTLPALIAQTNFETGAGAAATTASTGLTQQQIDALRLLHDEVLVGTMPALQGLATTLDDQMSPAVESGAIAIAGVLAPAAVGAASMFDDHMTPAVEGFSQAQIDSMKPIADSTGAMTDQADFLMGPGEIAARAAITANNDQMMKLHELQDQIMDGTVPAITEQADTIMGAGEIAARAAITANNDQMMKLHELQDQIMAGTVPAIQAQADVLVGPSEDAARKAIITNDDQKTKLLELQDQVIAGTVPALKAQADFLMGPGEIAARKAIQTNNDEMTALHNLMDQMSGTTEATRKTTTAIVVLSDTPPKIDTSSVKAATKEMGKLEKAADDAREAISKVNGADDEGFLKKLGRRAAGGPVSAGMPYIVGEVGPELFVPGTGGTIVPNSAILNPRAAEHFSGITSGASGGSTEHHYHFNVNAPVYGVNDMEDVVIKALERAQRRGRA